MTNKSIIISLFVVFVMSAVALVASFTPREVQLGGSTSDNWSIGGNLSVTGTGTITSGATLSSTLGVSGATTLSSTLTVSGESNLARTIQGGSTATISGLASSTLTAANLCDNSVLSITPTTTWGNPITLTFPATTTLYADCLTANGDFISLLLVNATSSYGASTTLAEGTGSPSSGIEIKKSADTGGDILILPQEIARLTLTRINSSTTTVEVHNFTDAD